MKYFRESIIFLLGITLGVFIIVGCAANVEAPANEKEVTTQETTAVEETAEHTQEPEIVEEPTEPVQETEQQTAGDCEAVQAELDALQARYDDLQAGYDDLQSRYGELQTENMRLRRELNTASSDYDDLNARYTNLLSKMPDIAEGDLERAVFDLINDKRSENGIGELEWTDTFYQWAKEHSNYLASKNLVEVSTQKYYQDVFRAAGYSSMDRITNAAWIIWEKNAEFERNFLNEQALYGTVAVSESDGIYYIVYFADVQK